MESELISILKKIDIISYGQIELANAGSSNVYVDIKKAYGKSYALNLIADELASKLDRNTNCIATLGYGGISPASVICARYSLNLILIRDEQKDHRKNEFIEGYIPSEKDRITIIDDVFTTGESIRKIIKILEPTKARIVGSCVVVKRSNVNPEFQLKYLTTLEELI